MVGDYSGQLNAGDGSARDLDDSVDKDTTDLFDLLDEPLPPASSPKKKKRN